MEPPVSERPAVRSEAVARALAELVRERLMQREPVTVAGLGTFRVRHAPSRVGVGADGHRALFPPRDDVALEPAADLPLQPPSAGARPHG